MGYVWRYNALVSHTQIIQAACRISCIDITVLQDLGTAITTSVHLHCPCHQLHLPPGIDLHVHLPHSNIRFSRDHQCNLTVILSSHVYRMHSRLPGGPFFGAARQTDTPFPEDRGMMPIETEHQMAGGTAASFNPSPTIPWG
jgi:hypothetical protein